MTRAAPPSPTSRAATGAEGRACADRAALAARYALVTDGAIVVPEISKEARHGS